APITELRLGLRQQSLGLFGMMRRVTVHAAHVVAGMPRSREVGLSWFIPVATEATRVRLGPREFLEDNNLSLVAASFHVRRSRTMTRLAPVTALQRRFEMWRRFEVLGVELLMARLTGIGPDILRGLR